MHNIWKYNEKQAAVAMLGGGAGHRHRLIQNIRLHLTGFLNSRIQVKNSKKHAKMR
jgi:hypothetical protein